MSKRLGVLALIASFFLFNISAFAQTLNDRQIYERCSSRLTRLSPDENSDPYISSIEAGTLKGPAACQQLFRLANLGADGKIPAFTGSGAASKKVLAERVLATMNEVHASWLTEKVFTAASNCRTDSTNALVDPMEPALFFTRALLGKDVPYSYVVTSNDNLRAIRSVNSPTRTVWDSRIDIKNLTGRWEYAGNGKLLGKRLLIKTGTMLPVKPTVMSNLTAVSFFAISMET